MRLNKQILLIFTLAISIKLLIFSFSFGHEERYLSNDSQSYHSTALAWVQTGSFSVDIDHIDIPETIRTPGYPLFLGMIYKTFGEGYASVIIFQIVLSILSIYLIYLIGAMLFGESTGYLVALIYAIDPVTIAMSYKILSETLFLFFLILFIFTGILWLDNPRSKLFPLVLGIIIGLLTLIRPITYYLPPFFIIGVIGWYYSSKYPFRIWFNQILIFIIPIFLIVGGWQYRNAIYANNSSLSQITGINLLYFRAAAIIADKDNLTFDQARESLLGDGIKNPWTYANMHPEKNIDKEWQNKGIKILTANPLLSLKMMFKGTLAILFGPGDGYLSKIIGLNIQGHGPLGDIFNLDMKTYINKWIVGDTVYFFNFIYSSVYLVMIYLGIVYWIYSSFNSNNINSADFFLWGILIYFLFISSGPEAYFRFRMPIMPILSIYSALGWEIIISRFKYFD